MGVAKLQALVRIPTVSYAEEDRIDADAFDRLHEELRRQFPLLHERLELTRVARHSLLLHWRGRSAARPVVLMAHQDVVPVEADAPWRHPAFDGVIEGGALWGRGTLDDKASLAAICEAVEELLAEGFEPAQDVWLSFGAREEVSGADATAAVETLRGRGVTPWFVLDEGGAIAHEAFPGVRPPLGVVGTTEKGTTSLRLVAAGRGGHSSTPAPGGPTAHIARAVTRLEHRQFASRIPAPSVELFRRIAPHAPAPLRPVLAHADRLAPVLSRLLVRLGPETAALTRTTMAVTMLEGSPAANVIASQASAVVNLRVLVGDTVEGVTAHVRRAIRDRGIAVEVVEANEPSPLSPTDDDAFRLLEQTIGEVFPDAVPTPYVMMAATDARFFTALCPRVYRFTPFRMTKAQRESIHSYDEHIGVEAYDEGVRWYRRLLDSLPEETA